MAGLPDLRLRSDRYLDLDAERAKARRLAAREADVDLIGLAHSYYAMTDDVDDRRRARYLAHIARAETRGQLLAELLPTAGSILEIGCGTGGLLAAAGSGRSIVGVDIALRWLVVARRRLADRGLAATLIGADAAALPWSDGRFDAVVADSVLEHLDDPAAALREWARVLRPGGRLVVWSPNRASLLPDPHVGLWGVGLLPERWASAYVRCRRGCAWTVRPLSAAGAARLLGREWTRVNLGPAPIDANACPAPTMKTAITLYRTACRTPGFRGVLRRFGPLWQLVAIREGGA